MDYGRLERRVILVFGTFYELRLADTFDEALLRSIGADLHELLGGHELHAFGIGTGLLLGGRNGPLLPPDELFGARAGRCVLVEGPREFVLLTQSKNLGGCVSVELHALKVALAPHPIYIYLSGVTTTPNPKYPP